MYCTSRVDVCMSIWYVCHVCACYPRWMTVSGRTVSLSGLRVWVWAVRIVWLYVVLSFSFSFVIWYLGTSCPGGWHHREDYRSGHRRWGCCRCVAWIGASSVCPALLHHYTVHTHADSRNLMMMTRRREIVIVETRSDNESNESATDRLDFPCKFKRNAI